MLCPHCQNEVSPEAQACPQCGHPISRESSPKSSGESSPKSRIAAALLCFFFGYLGLHNFYVGKFGSGLFQLGLSIFFSFGGGLAMIPLLSMSWQYAKYATGGAYLFILGAGLILSLTIIIDFIHILCGTFRDESKRRVDRW